MIASKIEPRPAKGEAIVAKKLASATGDDDFSRWIKARSWVVSFGQDDLYLAIVHPGFDDPYWLPPGRRARARWNSRHECWILQPGGAECRASKPG